MRSAAEAAILITHTKSSVILNRNAVKNPGDASVAKRRPKFLPPPLRLVIPTEQSERRDLHSIPNFAPQLRCVILSGAKNPGDARSPCAAQGFSHHAPKHLAPEHSLQPMKGTSFRPYIQPPTKSRGFSL